MNLPGDQRDNPREPGLLQRLPEPPRKVVILRASRIGDFINTTPALKAIRHTLPEAEISLITLPMLKEITLRSTDIDRFIPFPGYPGIAEQFFDPGSLVDFFAEMQKEEFDLAIQMQGSGVNANPFTLMLGAKFTAGFIRPEDAPALLDAALPLPEEGHEVERMLALTRFLGAPDATQQPEFPLWDEDHHAAEDLLSDARQPWFGIHTKARDLTRRWPLERFVEVARKLQDQYGGTIIIIGEKEEREEVSQALANQGIAFLNLAGLTSLPVTGAVLSRLQLFITNDTGPAHIAYAVKTPTITIFGSADPARYAPVNAPWSRQIVEPVPCRPCGLAECPIGTVCLTRVQPYQVFQACKELLRIRSTPLLVAEEGP